jgi:hypothetical protein
LFVKDKKLVYYFLTPIVVLLFAVRFYVVFPTDNNFKDPVRRLNEMRNWRNKTDNILNKIHTSDSVYANNYQIAAKLSFYSDKFIPALHIGVRSSEFDHINVSNKPKDEQRVINFISYHETENSILVSNDFDEPLYLINDMSYKEIFCKYARKDYDEEYCK